jgi:uncharacterized membrane protein
VAVLGPALRLIPIETLRFVVGALLLTGAATSVTVP